MLPLLTGMVPPLRTIVMLPAGAVSVPPQSLKIFGWSATTKPGGKLSVSVAFVSGVLVLELYRIMVRVDVPPLIVAGSKLLLTVGATAPGPGGGLTVKVAIA